MNLEGMEVCVSDIANNNNCRMCKGTSGLSVPYLEKHLYCPGWESNPHLALVHVEAVVAQSDFYVNCTMILCSPKFCVL